MIGQGTTIGSTPVPIRGEGMPNYTLVLMEALNRRQDASSQQQIADAKSAEEAASVEAGIYQMWDGRNGVLAQDGAAIEAAAGNATALAKAQAQYNVDSAISNAQTSQADGAVQITQQQTSSDATNLATEVQQLGQVATTISSYLTNLLGGLIA